MNLARVLDVSLPELPKLMGRERYFRFNPKITFRERVEKGVTNVYVVTEQTRKVFLLTPEKWKLVQLFNGVRNYEQIAKLWQQQCGVKASPEMIRAFAENLDASGFWLKTPEEAAMAMMEELKERQQRTKKTRSIRDFTKVYLVAIDADRQITYVHRLIRFVYTTPFVLGSIAALILMVGLWIARSDEVWRDSVLFWTMTDKTWRDVLEFYLIFAVVGFCHESGHALTAKNFGAEVHRTGMLLVYTMPAFFVETTEVVVHANYYQRMYVILAGFWYELMLCAVATFIWWGTAIGGTVHNLAYKVILVGGIMPVIFNMNPLMRLDGYLFFTKLIRQPFLKEKANAFLSGWVRNRIFGLPVYVEALPRRRAIFYASYAFLSGVYTYSVLLFLSRLTYRIVHNFSPDWAFIPAAAVALNIFRSRIEKFGAFLKALYEHHRETLMAHRKTFLAVAAVLVVFVFLPLWKEVLRAPVTLEPGERAVLTAHVDARVEDVMVDEGQHVEAGTPVAALRALEVEAQRAKAVSQLQLSSANATTAQLRYTDYASAEAERQQWSEVARVAGERVRRLSVTAPIRGIVVSPRVRDLRGTFLTEGSRIAEIQDVSTMRARIYVDDTDMRSSSGISQVAIKLTSGNSAMRGRIEKISPAPEDPDPGLIDPSKYKGLKPPPHYVVDVLLQNDGSLRSGMTGEAKLFGERKSIIGLLFRPVADFIGRKVW
jgi:putative peptide zinc metalloprotease protein